MIFVLIRLPVLFESINISCKHYCVFFQQKCDKFDPRENHKIAATICHVLKLKCTKFDFGWGSAPDSAEGAYIAPPYTP